MEIKQLDEKASRPADKEGSLDAQGSVEATADQKGQPGDTHANRSADKSGELPVVGSTEETSEQKGQPGDAHANRPADKSGELPVNEAEKCDDDEEEMDDEEDEDDLKEESSEVVTSAITKLRESAKFTLGTELGSLLESEGLTAEFQEKAVTIFEAAVNAAISSKLDLVEAEMEKIISEEVEVVKLQLEDEMEQYLDYVVTEWVEENRLAIESGVRVQMAESFMTGLTDLLEAHNIELPAEKTDMYEAQVAKVAELEESLSQRMEDILTLKEELAAKEKALCLESFVSGLTDVEAEKIRALSESVEFDDAEAFRGKLSILKENYFPTHKAGSAELITEDADGELQPVVESAQPKLSAEMAAYLGVMKKLG